MAGIVDSLMASLGYSRYIAQVGQEDLQQSLAGIIVAGKIHHLTGQQPPVQLPQL